MYSASLQVSSNQWHATSSEEARQRVAIRHKATRVLLTPRDRPRRHDKNATRDEKKHPELLSRRVGFDMSARAFDMSARAFDMSARAFDMSAQHADF